MKYLVLVIAFTFNFAFSGELEFLAADGSEYDKGGVPRLMVTEYLKEQGKLIQNGSVSKQWASYGKCQEVWKSDEGAIVCGTFGVWKYDNENTREVYFEPKMRPLEIHSCQPLEDGGMLVGVNKVLLELSAEGKIKKMIKIPYLRSEQRLQMKTVRKLRDGGYIISACAQNKVYILNKKGMVTRTINLSKIDLPTKVRRIHGVELLENGNVLIGTGYGSSLVEINRKDQVVWSLTPDDIPAIGLKYVGGFVIRENGNIIVAAYNSGFPMFEIDRDKKIILKVRRDKEDGIDLPTNLNLVATQF